MSHFKQHDTRFDTGVFLQKSIVGREVGQTVVNCIWYIIPALYLVGGPAITVSQVPMDFCIKTTRLYDNLPGNQI